MDKDIRQLRQFRLEKDLTYAQLAAALGLHWRTVYRILTLPGVGMHERTRYKLQVFLEKQRRVA